jgi:hypothetical protein
MRSPTNLADNGLGSTILKNAGKEDVLEIK